MKNTYNELEHIETNNGDKVIFERLVNATTGEDYYIIALYLADKEQGISIYLNSQEEQERFINLVKSQWKKTQTN